MYTTDNTGNTGDMDIARAPVGADTLSRCMGSKGRVAGGCARSIRQPGHQTNQMNGHCQQQMPQMGRRQPTLAAAAQPIAPHAVPDRFVHPGPLGISRRAGVRLLTHPSCPHRRMVDLGPNGQRPCPDCGGGQCGRSALARPSAGAKRIKTSAAPVRWFVRSAQLVLVWPRGQSRAAAPNQCCPPPQRSLHPHGLANG
ncbi:MAG: hypothetical protein MI924_30435 [Chloroflexales bacterium]|nr:hypothetical protein [Chloroflexales bacterium]